MLDEIIILSIDDVFTVESPKGRREYMYNRKSYGISLCYGGAITYTMGEHATLSDRNHLIVLPKGRDYSLYGNATGAFPVINIQCILPAPLEMPTAFRIRNPETYLKDYEKLHELFFFNHNNAKCLSILYNILGNAAIDNLSENRIVATVIDYINQHFNDPGLSNQVISRELGISEAYFRRQFQSVHHCTPKQYIRNLRMKKAEQLLSESTLGITIIAEKCGFSSVYHFSRAFQSSHGLSATEYRKTTKRIQI